VGKEIAQNGLRAWLKQEFGGMGFQLLFGFRSLDRSRSQGGIAGIRQL
jgi:hypothetical protein